MGLRPERSLRVTKLALLVVAGACSSPADEPPRLPGQDAPPCALGSSRYYLIDALSVPAVESETPDIDLSDPPDGTSDVLNHFYGWLEAGVGSLAADALTAAVQSGHIAWVIELASCDGDRHVRMWLRAGEVLTRSPSVTVTFSPSAEDIPLVGTLFQPQGEYVLSHGVTSIPLAAGYDSDANQAPTDWIASFMVSARMRLAGPALLTGGVGFGSPVEDALPSIAASVARTVTAAAAADPACPPTCVRPGLESLLGWFDPDGDRLVAAPDVLSSGYLQSLGYLPSLDLLARDDEGGWVYWPEYDGEEETDGASYSFRAIEAELAP